MTLIMAIITWLCTIGAALSFERPHACNENESMVSCMLIVQRNNALDELATAEAGRRDAMDHIDIMNAWWKQYAAGATAKQEWSDWCVTHTKECLGIPSTSVTTLEEGVIHQ